MPEYKNILGYKCKCLIRRDVMVDYESNALKLKYSLTCILIGFTSIIILIKRSLQCTIMSNV